jgi:hypothetical protein
VRKYIRRTNANSDNHSDYDAYVYRNTNANRNGHCHTYCDCHSNTNGNSNCYSDAYSYSLHNTNADSDWRVRFLTRLLEKPSGAVAANPTATWKHHL